ncbi:MAG: histidine kinase dimerization/phospho-acceptor domain-containing protein, partial [Ramlibacter sp.]
MTTQTLARPGSINSLPALSAVALGSLALLGWTSDSALPVLLIPVGVALGIAVATFFGLMRSMRAEMRKGAHEHAERLHQQAILNALINSIPDVIVYKDAHGTVLGCNSAYAAMSIQAADGTVQGAALDLLPDPSEAAVSEAGGTETWVCYPDGNRVLLDVVHTPLRSAHGEVIGMLAIGRDITGRRHAEDELRRARDEAQAAAHLKSDFLAHMSHEIRTPMNAVIGMTHLALQTQLTPMQRDCLDKVKASGQHLLGIINDILDFSKAEAGMLAIEMADFELAALLGNVSDLIKG